MTSIPLTFEKDHLFFVLDGGRWLVDTGAPTSLGRADAVTVAGRTLDVADGYMGLDADTLSGFVGIEISGLLGADMLSGLDVVFDVPAGRAHVSADQELALTGTELSLTDFMSIPIVEAKIRGQAHRLFFDTGSPISYLQDSVLAEFPSLDPVEDFYPGFGQFTTETNQLALTLGDIDLELRCGSLPGLLGMTLSMAGVSGILGNIVMADRKLGYFPKRSRMVLEMTDI